MPVPSIYSSASPWVGSRPCGAKYSGFCADSKGVKLLICGLLQKGRVLAQDGKPYVGVPTPRQQEWNSPKLTGSTGSARLKSERNRSCDTPGGQSPDGRGMSATW